MNETNSVMQEAAKFATEAAEKHANDTNWLAVILLFIAILALAWLFRWIIGELKTLFREANEGRMECAKIIATAEVRSSSVITECRDTIRECTEFMKRKTHIILIGFVLLIVAGCASLSPKGQARLVNSANFAAYAGTIETLKYLPTKRAGFERAVADLRKLETGPIDVIALSEIVQRLDVKELKSSEAKLIISGVQLAIVTELGATPLDQIANLKPIVTAIREGIERGLSQ